MSRRPVTISGTGTIWSPNAGQETSKYLVPDRNLFNARPYIQSGKSVFVWPIGVEGFTRSGEATLGIHKYIGDNAVDVDVVHRDESRITLSGILPGISSVENMTALIDVLTSIPPEPGLTLFMPGVFPKEQYVVCESYNFTHSEDDRTHSITYTISLIRKGVGRRISNPKGTAPPPNPGASTNPKGSPGRVFTARDGARTLKTIAAAVYHTSADWQVLMSKNEKFINETATLLNIPKSKIPTYRWPVGTHFTY